MLIDVLLFVAGLVLLVLGANVLVRGASNLAFSFGISPLVVGLTVVAFGTSAPEVAVSVGAALAGTTDIAIGNVVGSNIFNVLFILGLSAMITPLVVNLQLIRQEVPIMIGASVLLLLLSLDGQLSWSDGGILVVLMVAYTAFWWWACPPENERWDQALNRRAEAVCPAQREEKIGFQQTDCLRYQKTDQCFGQCCRPFGSNRNAQAQNVLEAKLANHSRYLQLERHGPKSTRTKKLQQRWGLFSKPSPDQAVLQVNTRYQCTPLNNGA